MASTAELQILIAAVNRSSSELRKVSSDLRAVERATGQTNQSFQAANRQATSLTKSVAGMAGGFIAAQASLYTVQKAFDATVGAAIDFESSFAGIRKTVDATEEEFKALEQANRNMAKSIPVSVNEINRIGETAGALGITGVKNIENFERTIATLAVTTNLTADEAATAFGKIRTALDIPVDDLDNLASAIVDLGNKGASTESEITEFLNRIAGAGKLASIPTAALAGIASSFASLGVEAEAGGTAIQRVLLGMIDAAAKGGKELEVFAAVTGTTAEGFRDLLKTDPTEAFVRFVEGLGASGDDAIRVLDALGLADARLTSAFLKAAGAGDELRRQIDIGTAAYAQNTAAQAELEKRMNTFAAKWQILKNRITDVGISIGQEVLPELTRLADGVIVVFDAFERFEQTRVGGFMVQLAKYVFGLDSVIRDLGINWKNVWNEMARAVEPVVNAVARVAVGMFNAIAPVFVGIERAKLAVVGGVAAMANAMAGMAGGWRAIWNNIVGVLDTAAQSIASILNSIAGALGTLTGSIGDFLTGLQGFGSSVASFLGKIPGAGKFVGAVTDAVAGLTPTFDFEAPQISIPRFGADAAEQFGPFIEEMTTAGVVAEDVAPNFDALAGLLEDTGSGAGGAAKAIDHLAEALTDGTIDVMEAAQLGLGPAEAAHLELARARDIEAIAARNAQFELEKLAVVLGERGITAEAFELQLALQAIADELERSGRTVTEFLRDMAQDAVDALTDAFGGLFSKPTREAADLNRRISEAELERARKDAAGASEDEIRAIEDHIESLRKQKRVLDANSDLQRANFEAADQTLITEEDKAFAAALYTIAMQDQTTQLDQLNAQAHLEALARNHLINSMQNAAAAYNATAGVDNNQAFFDSLPAGDRESLARLLEELAKQGRLHSGTNYVPRDGMYELQRGERVISRSENESGSWGGMQVGTINVTLPNVRQPQDFGRELDRYFRGRN